MTYDIFDERKYGDGSLAEVTIDGDTFYLARRVSEGEATPRGTILVDVYNPQAELLFRIEQLNKTKQQVRVAVFGDDDKEFITYPGEVNLPEMVGLSSQDSWTIYHRFGSDQPIHNEEIVKKFEEYGLIPPEHRYRLVPVPKQMAKQSDVIIDVPPIDPIQSEQVGNLEVLQSILNQEAKITF